MKGIIFDFDGTLADSMCYWSQLSRKYLRLKGKETDEETENKLKSMPVYKSSAYIKEKYNLEDDVEKIATDIYSLMVDYYKDIIELKPNVLHYLDSLKEKGVKMGIATATDLTMVDLTIERLKLRDYFEFIISSRQYNTSKAESPLIYEEALKLLGTPKDETVIFEDAAHAIKTAKDAGFYVIGVYDDYFKSDEEYIKSRVDKFIYNFSELME